MVKLGDGRESKGDTEADCFDPLTLLTLADRCELALGLTFKILILI